MTALNRKLLRDLWQMRGQAIAIALVIACGIMTFVMCLSMLYSLDRTRENFYEKYRFAHVFAQLKRAPDPLSVRVADIPGVAQVETRVIVGVTLDVEGVKEPAAGRIVSIPDYEAPALNGLYLRSGRYPEPGVRGEVLASEAFCKANELKPGDRVRAVINGRRQDLIITGVALSPEFVFQMREGEMIPDDRRYGVFWMRRRDLAGAYNMEGAFNDVQIRLAPGASEAVVKADLDRLLAPYGGLGSYGREEHPSAQFISNEIKQLQGNAVIAPSIFLSVAAFLLNVVMARQLATQREQIAALKAFGYTPLEVGVHYLKLVMLIVLVGVVIGSVGGSLLGKWLAYLYTRWFHFPALEYEPDLGTILGAIAISLFAALAGTIFTVRRAMKLPPAEAMRPEPPAKFGPTILERLGLGRLLSSPARMVMRNLERKPIKAVFSVLAIAMAVAVVVLGNFVGDAVESVTDTQYQFAQRQDMTVTFIEPTSERVVYELAHLPGVRTVEPTRTLPARVRAGYHSRRIGIQGIDSDGELYRLLDVNRQEVGIPPDGVVLSEILAQILDVKPGDTVVLEVQEGQRPVREVIVTGVVNDFAGTSAYMDRQAIHRLMREQDSITGAYLTVDPEHTGELYTSLKNTPRVAGVTVKQAALQNFYETIAQNMLIIKSFNVTFACIIAFGVVYNAARISLAERSRELATLRVMGFTRGEISQILLGELAVLTVVALPVGLLMGYVFAWGSATANTSEMFRMPLIVYPSTYGFAVVVVLGASLVSGLIVRRMLDTLDLVAVLKSRE